MFSRKTASILYNALVRRASIKKEVISTCMDPRINSELMDSVARGRFIIRNAGGMIQEPGVDVTTDDNVKITLQAGFEAFTIIGHSDCAAGRLAKPENGIVRNHALRDAWETYSAGSNIKVDSYDHAHHTDGAVRKGVAISLANLLKHGWNSKLTGGIFYDVDNGQIEIFNKISDIFLSSEEIGRASVQELVLVSNLSPEMLGAIKLWNNVHKIKSVISG